MIRTWKWSNIICLTPLILLDLRKKWLLLDCCNSILNINRIKVVVTLTLWICSLLFWCVPWYQLFLIVLSFFFISHTNEFFLYLNNLFLSSTRILSILQLQISLYTLNSKCFLKGQREYYFVLLVQVSILPIWKMIWSSHSLRLSLHIEKWNWECKDVCEDLTFG